MSDRAMIEIGPSGETVVRMSNVILAILRSKQDQKTMRAALRCLRQATTVKNVTVQNCTFGERKP